MALLLLAASTLCAAGRAAEPNITIQNDHYLVEVGRRHGRIIRVYDKRGKLELLQEARLADNFRFSLPLRGKAAWQATEANYILGKDQRLSSHQFSDAGLALAGDCGDSRVARTGMSPSGVRAETGPCGLVLHWNGPLASVTGKSYDVSAVMTIELSGEAIRFTFTIRNATDLEIGEVCYPILGGSLGLGEATEVRRKTELVVPGTTGTRKETIYHTFTNAFWLGILGAEQYYGYPDVLCMPWMALDHPALGRSVYFGSHDPVARYKVIHLEMSPGTAPSRAGGNWPRADELKGIAAGVKICFVHFPYQPPGEDFEASPVVVRFHDGDWRQGAAVYGNWLRRQYEIEKPRVDWPYRTQAFQQCGSVPLEDLPRWAQQGAAAGVKGLLLSEWKVGGTDNGIPRFEPASEPGATAGLSSSAVAASRQELADAIRQCHALGVKVALAIDLSPATQLDATYQEQLHKYTCTDRWGVPYTKLGWPEGQSVTGGFGRGERRVWLNPGHPGMRDYLVGQLRELAALGVDGVHLEGFFGRPLDFNPTVGKTADRASWEGGIECIDAILESCRAVRPGFSVSVDTLWDHLLPETQICSLEAVDSSALAAAFPFVQPTFSVTDEDSVGAVNNAMLWRGRLRIAPANGEPMGGPGMERLVGYLKAVLAAREALAHTLLEGERLVVQLGALDGLRPTVGLPKGVAGTAGQASSGTRRAGRGDQRLGFGGLWVEGVRVGGPAGFGVFRNATSGLRTAVVVNRGAEPIDFQLGGFVEPAGKPVLLWQPAAGVRKVDFPARVHIPGRQLAVITEETAYERLAAIGRWTAPVRVGKVIFDLASSEDLRGWTLRGTAFSVSPLGALCRRPTLNSLSRSGESATGSALSPSFTVDPRYGQLEIVLHGGRSQQQDGRENLAIELLDANTGALLEQVLPPATHVLTTRRLAAEKLQGRSIRVKLVDENTASTYAWIGVHRLSLIDGQGPDGEK